MRLAPLSRLLLWDYDRGSLPYDMLCVLMLLFLLAVPPEWLRDPLVIGR
ncbi:MAG TPA: hypothetical protein VMR21_11525 [Vicinamibacteria bacterium]|nr:hypothetical protein [Vicinamibacteria bacterium]